MDVVLFGAPKGKPLIIENSSVPIHKVIFTFIFTGVATL